MAPGRSGLDPFEVASFFIQVLSHTQSAIPYDRVSCSFGELSIPGRQLPQLSRIGHCESLRALSKKSINSDNAEGLIWVKGISQFGLSNARCVFSHLPPLAERDLLLRSKD
jgi:hypothetical protein